MNSLRSVQYRAAKPPATGTPLASLDSQNTAPPHLTAIPNSIQIIAPDQQCVSLACPALRRHYISPHKKNPTQMDLFRLWQPQIRNEGGTIHRHGLFAYAPVVRSGQTTQHLFPTARHEQQVRARTCRSGSTSPPCARPCAPG